MKELSKNLHGFLKAIHVVLKSKSFRANKKTKAQVSSQCPSFIPKYKLVFKKKQECSYVRVKH